MTRRIGRVNYIGTNVDVSVCEVVTYLKLMRSLFNIQVLPLYDLAGTVATDKGINGIDGTYANVAGLTLGNSIPPFVAPILGATSYVNHNAALIDALFSYLTGTYHFWVYGSLALWDDAVARRLILLQADTSNRIDITKSAGGDTIRCDYKAATVSNYKDILSMTYSSGWFPIGLRWNKAGDAFDIFINGRKKDTITGLGDIAGAITNATMCVSPNFPAGSLAYLGLGNELVSDTNFKRLAGMIHREKLIIFDGDSLTIGGQLGAVPYPKQLIRLYYADAPLPNNVGYNCGNSGEQLEVMITSAPTTVDIYFGDDGFTDRICVLWGGTNDIAGAESAAEVEGEIQTYCLARKAVGWKVLVSTIIPNGEHSAGEQAIRAEVNTWIIANYASFADGLIDPTVNAAFDNEADVADPTYYNADTVHLTTAGYGIIAAIAKTAIDAL